MTSKKPHVEQPASGLRRREFLEYCGGLAAIMTLPGCGADEAPSPEAIMRTLLQGMEAARPPVIWLEAQDCAGCSIAFLNAEQPSVGEILLKALSLRYHETLMAASGEVAEQVRHESVEEGGYILVVEGSVPQANERFCTVAGRPIVEIVEECASQAALVVALGSCASFGGIPRMTPSRGQGVSSVVHDKPVVNLPMCPGHPDHVVATIVHFLQNQAAPRLDLFGRPKMFFSRSVHSQCSRRRNFTLRRFLTDWNDPAQANYCLYNKGCRGRQTYSDCATRKFNGQTNHCLTSGAPCQGCAQPSFFANEEPLFGCNTVAPQQNRKWGVA